jgi:hypothetical protein
MIINLAKYATELMIMYRQSFAPNAQLAKVKDI